MTGRMLNLSEVNLYSELDGARIARAVIFAEALSQRHCRAFDRAIAQAKKLSTNDPSKLAIGLTTLAQTIQSELTATGKRFSDLETKYDFGDLNEALADEPACKPFVSSAS